MNLSSTMSEFGRAAESTLQNMPALTFREAVARWFESSGLRDSPVAQEIMTVLLFLLFFLVLLVLSTAILVLIGVRRQARSARWQIALQDTPLTRIMVTDFRSLSATDSLRDAVGNVLKSLQQHFLVLDGQHAAGVLSRSELLASLDHHAPETTLAEIVRPNFAEITPADTIAIALRRLQQTRQAFLAVVETGRILGFVTEETLGDYVRAETALQSRAAMPPLCAAFPTAERGGGGHHT